MCLVPEWSNPWTGTPGLHGTSISGVVYEWESMEVRRHLEIQKGRCHGLTELTCGHLGVTGASGFLAACGMSLDWR